MKYCKNCGMLLEDSSDICIGCGLDTSNPDNVSKYPPKMEKKLEAEKKVNKTRRTTIIAIIIVFVLLLGLLCFILFNSSDFFAGIIERFENFEAFTEEEDYEDYEDWEVDDSSDWDDTEEEDVYDPRLDPNRTVKDDEGSYYSRYTLTDEGGNKIFTGLYPEDFIVNSSAVDYSKYSVRFPGRVTFSVGNTDDTVHFTYLSPEQFWYKKSETKKVLQNDREIMFYMSYLTYGGGQGYADMLIKASYPKAKKITMTESRDADPFVKDKLAGVSKAFKSEIDVNTMDEKAHIASDAVYAAMESEYTAQIYHYEVVNQDKTTLFLDFYVPVIANNIYYSSKSTGDRGTMTEWITLGVFCFEAGNEDLYDDFLPAFNVFMDNCIPCLDFYNICELRGKDIVASYGKGEQAPAVDAATLTGYSSRLTGSLTAFDEEVYKFTSRRADDKIFMLDDYVLNAKQEMSVAFVNAEKEKVFISPASDEYPGAGYLDMDIIDYDTLNNSGADASYDDHSEDFDEELTDDTDAEDEPEEEDTYEDDSEEDLEEDLSEDDEGEYVYFDEEEENLNV